MPSTTSLSSKEIYGVVSLISQSSSKPYEISSLATPEVEATLGKRLRRNNIFVGEADTYQGSPRKVLLFAQGSWQSAEHAD